jgi:hypothetical protein
VTAAEERIPNEGEKNFVGRIKTWSQGNDGHWRARDNVDKAVKVQIADVSHPLMAVKRMCLAGHRVVFDEEGSYAVNKFTKEVIEIGEEDGEYVMEMWVQEGNQGFPRQGQ